MKKKVILGLGIFLVFIIVFVFNDKIYLASKGYSISKVETIYKDKTSDDITYKVMKIYKDEELELVCLKKNPFGIWSVMGGYVSSDDVKSINFLTAKDGVNEYTSICVVNKNYKNINKDNLQLPESTTCDIIKINDTSSIIKIVATGDSVEEMNDYELSF